MTYNFITNLVLKPIILHISYTQIQTKALHRMIMEPLPKSPRAAITPPPTPRFAISAPATPSPEVVDIVKCNHNKVLSCFTRKLLGCMVCFKPKDMDMEMNMKPEYKKDKVVAVSSFSGNVITLTELLQ
ncbi:hypothetical protein CTI12_AA320560 [Artemisia annua]|uniref:Uncharacterized protein n=1 Tax=Artemisia annua TaxID=35608 RepID=A0A2U1N0X9_ARTAN|nr:hypothetical protein CTI12_AA320560 [Artemisia annua]